MVSFRDAAAALAVNTADGSCWVADNGAKQVIHLSRTGAELWRGDYDAVALAVNPTDGSVWLGIYQDSGDNPLVHLSAAGAEILRLPDADAVYRLRYLAVNPQNGSCWVGDMNDTMAFTLKHFASDGTLLWTVPPASLGLGFVLSLNPTDGSVWTAGWTFVPGSGDTAALFHLSADNQVLWSRTFGSGNALPTDLAVDPSSGNCWCRLQSDLGDLLLLSPSDGAQIGQISAAADPVLGSGRAGALSLDPADGSLWTGAPRRVWPTSPPPARYWRRTWAWRSPPRW